MITSVSGKGGLGTEKKTRIFIPHPVDFMFVLSGLFHMNIIVNCTGILFNDYVWMVMSVPRQKFHMSKSRRDVLRKKQVL